MMSNSEHQLYKQAIGSLLPDQDSIRSKVLRMKTATTTRRPHRWLIPVAAGIVALAVVCVSVPSVRAAIAQWFTVNRSVQNYIAQPADIRPSTPELDAIIDETMPEETVMPNSIEIVKIVPDWQEWADKLNPTLGDVFFDGKELMVSFNMGGGAPELIMGGNGNQSPYQIGISMSNPGYVILNGKKVAHSVSSHLADSDYIKYLSYINNDGSVSDEGIKLIEADKSVSFTTTIDFTHTKSEDAIKAEDLPAEHREQYYEDIKKVQAYDPEYNPKEFLAGSNKLEGIQLVEIHIPLMVTDYAAPIKVDDMLVHQSEIIGIMKLCFSFDPSAGYKNMQSYIIDKSVEFIGEGTYAWADRDSDPDYITFVNKTVDMAGVKMTAKRMDCYASGAELYVSITCPESWSELDKQCFLHSLIPSVKGDGTKLNTSGEQYGLEENGEDLGMCIYLDMLASELDAIDTFEIELILSRFAGYDDVPYVEGEPTKIKKDDVKGWQEESTVLKDCTLTFKIK